MKWEGPTSGKFKPSGVGLSPVHNRSGSASSVACERNGAVGNGSAAVHQNVQRETARRRSVTAVNASGCGAQCRTRMQVAVATAGRPNGAGKTKCVKVTMRNSVQPTPMVVVRRAPAAFGQRCYLPHTVAGRGR